MSAESLPEADRLLGSPHPRMTARLYGQGAAEAAFLEAAHGGRLHHGWLLTGPRGTGKATLAWRIARFLVAGGRGDNLSMDPEHPVFRRAAQLAEPGIALCRRAYDEKAKRFKTALTVNEVRALKGHFALSSADGGWRVAIIDAADEMNTSAANALLKLLEEPPARSVLLLVCHSPASLLPTIRSRCRTLALQPLGPEDLAAAVAAAGYGVPEDPFLPVLCGGSVGEAIRLIEGDGTTLYREILSLLGSAPTIDRQRVAALAERCAGRGAEDLYDLTLRLISLALGRVIRIGAGGPAEDLQPEEAAIAARLVPSLNAAQHWAERLQQLEARQRHARSVNLDPAQVILDLLLSLDRTAARLA